MRPNVRLELQTLDVRRVIRLFERFPGCRDRLFTEDERAYCERNRRKPHQHFAARLAAKFAVRGLLGGGLLREIEVLRDDLGAPSLRLTGTAETLRADRPLCISLTHEGHHAAAYVSLEDAL